MFRVKLLSGGSDSGFIGSGPGYIFGLDQILPSLVIMRINQIQGGEFKEIIKSCENIILIKRKMSYVDGVKREFKYVIKILKNAD